MAGNQHRGYLHTGDAVCVLVVQEQRIAEVRLVDPLNRGCVCGAAVLLRFRAGNVCQKPMVLGGSLVCSLVGVHVGAN